MKYRFRFQNSRGVRYLWLAAFSLPALLLLSWLQVRNGIVIAAVTIVPLLLAFYLFARKGKAQDEITVDDKGLTSAWFGRIEYASIEKVDGSGFIRTPPSLKLYLRSGHTVTWLLSHRGSIFNSQEDAAVFSLFTEVLIGKMSKKEAYEKYTQYAGNTPSPATQLEKAVQQNRKKQGWFIPVSLLIAILAVVRTCGKDWFRRKDPDFAAIARYEKQELEANLVKAKKVMAEKVAHYGPVYLYTNDTAARIELLPDIQLAEMPRQLSLFRNGMMSDSLKKFIEHPDDYGVTTVLVKGDGNLQPMQKSRLNKRDSTSRYLYFRIFVPRNGYPASVRSRVAAGRDTTTVPDLDFATAIPVYDTTQLMQALDGALPNTRMLLAQLRFNTGCKVYITGSAQDSIPHTLFLKAVATLDKQRKEVNADSVKFVLKTWHRDVAR